MLWTLGDACGIVCALALQAEDRTFVAPMNGIRHRLDRAVEHDDPLAL
jgi:hypothetical protein